MNVGWILNMNSSRLEVDEAVEVIAAGTHKSAINIPKQMMTFEIGKELKTPHKIVIMSQFMWKRVLQIWERGREGCTRNSGSTTGMRSFGSHKRTRS